MPTKIPGTILGLVDAGDAGGCGGAGRWSLVLHLAGWRQPGSSVEVGKRRCEMPVPDEDLRPWMDRIKAYSIIEAEIDADSTSAMTKLLRIVRTGASDPDLEQLAAQLQEPIVIHDPALGRLEYERKYSDFEGRADWCGRDVAISLNCVRPDEPSAVLAAATRLFADQAAWDLRVRKYAVEQLLPLKNDSWIEDDEEKLSEDAFLSRMTLESISVEESGGFVFWHNDGDLFWGHAIQISGNLSEGLTDADIPG